jgi:hypothetical protein
MNKTALLICTENREFMIDTLLVFMGKEELSLKCLLLNSSKFQNPIEIKKLLDGENLFEESSSFDKLSVTLLDDDFDFKSFEPVQDKIYWIKSLDSKQKLDIKKIPTTNFRFENPTKITKKLTESLEKEIGKSVIKEYNSYYELLEEAYIRSLLEGSKNFDKKLEPTPLFFLSVNNLNKFYQSVTENEIQLILSLILTKSLKAKNYRLSKEITRIDYNLKSGKSKLTTKNCFGLAMFDYLNNA